MLGVVYEFESVAVIKLIVGGVPIYFSNRPRRDFTEKFVMPYEYCLLEGNAHSLPSECRIERRKFSVLGHYIDSSAISIPTVSVTCSAVYLRHPTLLEHNHVQFVWVGVDSR